MLNSLEIVSSIPKVHSLLNDKIYGPLKSGINYTVNAISNISYTNIYENNKAKIINILAPGESKESISVYWQDEFLYVKSHAKNKEKSTDTYLMREFNLENLDKCFKVESSKYDVTSIEAGIENGIVSITVPKLNKEKTKIEVKLN